jgi:uncharacterized protein YqjF (DUF2071 family)
MSRPDPVGQPLLTAEWRWLAMLNYEINPAVLAPYVPLGTELDSWNERTFVSVIGFLFLETRLRGFAIPFHRDFEEVNLRFYVRRQAEEGWRRGVVFLRELVPRTLIAWTARLLYNENYVGTPMGHRISTASSASGTPSVSYWWRLAGHVGEVRLEARSGPETLVEGSLEEFISEHYWGYARRRDGATLEYRVEHPRWRIWQVEDSELRGGVRNLHSSSALTEPLSHRPASAFLAEGSPISVYPGVRLEVRR